MNATTFSSPVLVKDGNYIVREIVSVDGAIDFLEEWPESRRDLIHETALKACYDAHDGHKPVSVARNAFIGFGKRASILEDPASVISWIAPSESGSGMVAR
ncbi:Protein of unknown function [Mesorhizobium albiziae]|uniref:DUF982 domain-containing protein n=1 Tax=Neomesorhizobium albiziae TaxID=335020 RepID=A0A1I4EZH7_9HYPH|nr:DUF982 domain-containing protein [Mesorhizobium albiziae]GLS33112.1 hypothetical protein GCM10007937_48230 [Mesorhizobium albiziae]SFL11064.1 Protein of unknown function [Mesorhizobium albiziae]